MDISFINYCTVYLYSVHIHVQSKRYLIDQLMLIRNDIRIQFMWCMYVCMYVCTYVCMSYRLQILYINCIIQYDMIILHCTRLLVI